MLEIRINNQTADIKGTSIKMVLNSPAFSNEAIVGDHSYTLSFPDTPTNRKIFGYQNRKEAQVLTDLDFKIDIYFYGNKSISGRFVLQKAKDFFSGNIQAGSHNFMNQVKGKTTNQVDFGTVNFANSTEMQNHINAAQTSFYPDYKFTWFPVRNMALFDDSPMSWQEEASDSGSELPPPETAGDKWRYFDGYFNIGGIPGQIVLFPYFAHVINKLFSAHGIKVVENFFESHDELKQLVLYTPFRLLTITGNRYNLKDHVGKYDILDLLTQTRNTFNVGFFTNHNNNLMRMVPLTDLLTSDAIDWTNKLLGKHEKDFNYDYLSGVDYGYEFDSGDETLEEHQLVGDSLFDVYNYAGTVTMRTDLPDYTFPWDAHINEMWYVKSESRYFVFSPRLISQTPYVFQKWVTLTYDLFRFKTGLKQRENSSKLSTLISEYSTESPYWSTYRLTPRSDQGIVSKEGFNTYFNVAFPWLSFNPDYINNINPRLLFYRGKADWDDQGLTFPYATYSEYDPYGNEVYYHTLRWTGQNGLYQKYHANWVRFLEKTSLHLFEMKLAYTDIANIDLTKRYKIGSNYFLIKKIQFDMPLKGAAKVEMMRINL